MRLEDDNQNGIEGGVATYNASGWKDFATTGTDGNTPEIELLAGTYKFRMRFDGETNQQSNIDISSVNPVVFVRNQTSNARMASSAINTNISSDALNELEVFPNPFREQLKLTYAAPHEGLLVIDVYNLQGQNIYSLFNAQVEKGEQLNQSWNGRDNSGQILSSGMYLIQLQIGETRIIKKVMLK